MNKSIHLRASLSNINTRATAAPWRRSSSFSQRGKPKKKKERAGLDEKLRTRAEYVRARVCVIEIKRERRGRRKTDRCVYF